MSTINEGPHDPNIFKAIFMVGTPGAGKTFIGKRLIAGTGIKVINPDDIVEYYLQHKKATNLDKVYHQINQKTNLYLDGRLGILIDQTGNNATRIESYKTKLESLGYDCAMVFVYVDPKLAIWRLKERENKTLRKVDLDYFKHSVKNVFNNAAKYTSMFGSNFYRIDNSTAEAYPALEKQINYFLRKPISTIGQEWKKKQIEPMNEEFIDDGISGYRIFADMDGVLCDFEGQFKNTDGNNGLSFEEYAAKFGAKEAWQLIDVWGADWWSKLPELDEGMHLWHYLKRLPNVSSVEILSAPSRRNDSKTGKIAWVKKHLGSDVKIHLTKDKGKLASSKNDILIDDRPENVANFIQCGGSAILYHNFSDTINKLELIMGQAL